MVTGVGTHSLTGHLIHTLMHTYTHFQLTLPPSVARRLVSLYSLGMECIEEKKTASENSSIVELHVKQAVA
jgi:hypothetical protein